LPRYALTGSPFALLDAFNSLRLVTAAVHEDDTLCLALACRPLRDALGARFPACPRAGCRAVARLASKVTHGVLDLSNGRWWFMDDDGGLPSGLSRLAYLPEPGLRRLDLKGYRRPSASMPSVLPAGLWSLVGLEELDLEHCELRVLPEAIGQLTRLRTLSLKSNPEMRTLPEGLFLLEKLEVLHLSQCGLRALPEAIGQLTGLRTLNLSRNDWQNLPARLWSLVGLEKLYMYLLGSGWMLGRPTRSLPPRSLPEAIGQLTGLRMLTLSRNNWQNLPAGLWSLVGLERLDLVDCAFTESAEVAGVVQLTGLRKLNLSLNKLQNNGLPDGLWSMVGLKELSLAKCKLTALSQRVGWLSGLRKLNVSGNVLSVNELTSLPAELWSLIGLEELDLGCCELMVLPEGIGALAGLRTLDLRCNEELTTLPAELGWLRNLETLHLDDLEDLDDQPRLAVLQDLQQVRNTPSWPRSWANFSPL
jgi:Leucine-rich repeat (LRR) protein